MTSRVSWAGEVGSAGNDAVQPHTEMPIIVLKMKRTIVIGVCIGMIACTQQTLPEWVRGPTAPTQPANLITSLVADRTILYGGRSMQGTVTVQQAVTSDTAVQLSASDAAVSVPASTVIRSGSNSASFPIATSPVNSDRGVTVTATIAGRPYVMTFELWQFADNDFSYEIAPSGAFGHFTAATATLSASCSENHVTLQVLTGNSTQWIMSFGAPPGRALRTGVYDNTGGVIDQPSLTFAISPISSCAGAIPARFVITEMDLPPRGPVRRFVGSFEAFCRDGRSVRGEIHLLSPTSSVIPAGLIGCAQ